MKRLVVAIAIASLVLATAAPAFSVDPVDPGGNPVSTEGVTEPSDSLRYRVRR